MRNPKIQITCLEKTSNKLRFVKLIKEFSGNDLRTSKEVVDSLERYNDTADFFYVGNIDEMKERLTSFRREMLDMDGVYNITCLDTELDREHKLLSIGLGTREECVDFLGVYSTMFKNYDDIFKIVINYLSDSQLIEVISKLEKY